MARIKFKRIYIKVGTALLSVFLLIPLNQIYQANIQSFAKAKGLDKIYEKGVGFVMESTLGAILLASFFIIVGASLTMWIEDWLKSLKERKTADRGTVECNFDLKYNPDSDQFSTFPNENRTNFKTSWRRGRPNDFDVFVMFESPIPRPIVLIWSDSGKGSWSETFSSNEFIFLNFTETNKDEIITVNIYSADDFPNERRQHVHQKNQIVKIQNTARLESEEKDENTDQP
jgi:hypothetical protein